VVNAHPGEFTLLSVAVDNEMDPQGYVKQNGYTWNFASTTDDIISLYGLEGIPMTLFIDRRGRILAKQVGSMDKVEFEQYLAKIL
jgi:hypothetical protein